MRLECADGALLELPLSFAAKSKLIAGMLEDGFGLDEVIPISQVSKPTMEKICVFCEHLQATGCDDLEIEHPLPSNDLSRHVDEWYVSFISDGVDQATLFDLALAANYLDIKPLLKLASARIATQIRSKPIEEIRRFFKMTNDFTPEEEAQVREENTFAAQYF